MKIGQTRVSSTDHLVRYKHALGLFTRNKVEGRGFLLRVMFVLEQFNEVFFFFVLVILP